jgi:molecular chaperone DnaJ
MADDYYTTLGVDSNATLDQIKSAYRSKAKKLHPDCGGECEPFRDIQEAYEVLRDPMRRRAYDDDLASMSRLRSVGRNRGADPFGRRHSPVEPVMPNRRPDRSRTDYFDWAFESLFGEIFGREWPDTGFSSRSRMGFPSGLQVEVALTWDQARRGGRLRIWVPVQTRCAACRGFGRTGYFVCRQCSGAGVVVEENPIDFEFPRGIADGSAGTVSLDDLGMPGEHLIVRFRVRAR